MSKLVKLQIRNVFHSKFFYVCLILTVLLSPVASFLAEMFIAGAKISPVFTAIVDFFSFQLDLISKIFIAIICCMDFNEGTTKNIIARGYTKTQLLFSKYIASLVGLFTMFLVVIVLSFALFIKNGLGFESNMILLLINSFIAIIAYTIMYATISFLLEKNASAIIACLFIPTVVGLVLSLLDGNLKLGVGKYWIDNVSDEFIKNPTLSNLWLPIGLYGAYIVAFILGGTSLLKNKEIK